MNRNQISSLGIKACAHVFLAACSYNVSVTILAFMAVSNLSVILAATAGLYLVSRPLCINHIDQLFAQRVEFWRQASTVARLLDIGLSAALVASNIVASGFFDKALLVLDTTPYTVELITNIPWKEITGEINNNRLMSAFFLTYYVQVALIAISFYKISTAALALMHISSRLLSLLGSLMLTTKFLQGLSTHFKGAAASAGILCIPAIATTLYCLGSTYLAAFWLALGTVTLIATLVQKRRSHNFRTSLERWIQAHPEQRNLAETIQKAWFSDALSNKFKCDFGGAEEIPELDYGAFRIVEFVNYQGEQLPATLTQSTKLIKLKLTRCDNIQQISLCAHAKEVAIEACPQVSSIKGSEQLVISILNTDLANHCQFHASTLTLKNVNVPAILRKLDWSLIDKWEVSSSTLLSKNDQYIPIEALPKLARAQNNSRWLARQEQHPFKLWLSRSPSAVEPQNSAAQDSLCTSAVPQAAAGTDAINITHLVRDITTNFIPIQTTVQLYSSAKNYILQTSTEEISNSLNTVYNTLQRWQQHKEQDTLRAYRVARLENNFVTLQAVNEELDLSDDDAVSDVVERSADTAVNVTLQIPASEEGAIIELSPSLRSIIEMHFTHDRGMLMPRTIEAVIRALSVDLEKDELTRAQSDEAQVAVKVHLDAPNDPVPADNVLEKCLVVRDESEPVTSAASSSEQKPLAPLTKHEMFAAFQIIKDHWLRPTPVMQLHELIHAIPQVFDAADANNRGRTVADSRAWTRANG